MTASQWFFLFATLAGGLGLFIFGMRTLTQGLQALAGARLRTLLSRLTKRKLSGAAAGTIIGALVMSGTSTVMLVGFINAGLLSLEAAIPVMIGNNLGTTLTLQLFAFNIGKYCYLAIAIGFFTNLISRNSTVRELGLMIIGIGLLFLGMNTMSLAVEPLKAGGYFENLLRFTDGSTVIGMLLGVLLGALVTATLQSSGATIGMMFALAHAGAFTSFNQVFPLVLGTHIGTTVVGLLASLGTNIEARRLAVSHLSFNIIGTIIAIVMFPLYAKVIPLMGDAMVRQIANSHTVVQLFTGIVVLPFSTAFAAFVRKITPSSSEPVTLGHLEEDYLETPETAIVAVLQETRRMANLARKMVRQAMGFMVMRSTDKMAAVLQGEDSVDLLHSTITDYLFQLSQRPISRRQAVILQHLQRTVSEIERIGDHAEKLIEIVREKNERKVWFDDESLRLLVDLYQKADGILSLMVESLNPRNQSFEACGQAIIEAREEYEKLSSKIRARYIDRVLSREDDATHGIIHENITTVLDKIVSHSRNIATEEQSPHFKVKVTKLGQKTGGGDYVYQGKGAAGIDLSIFQTQELDRLDDGDMLKDSQD